MSEKTKEMMTVLLIPAEEEPELYLVNEAGNEMEIWFIDDSQIGEDYIVFADEDCNGQYRYYGAKCKQVYENNVLIEMLTEQELLALELVLKTRRNFCGQLSNYFEDI